MTRTYQNDLKKLSNNLKLVRKLKLRKIKRKRNMDKQNIQQSRNNKQQSIQNKHHSNSGETSRMEILHKRQRKQRKQLTNIRIQSNQHTTNMDSSKKLEHNIQEIPKLHSKHQYNRHRRDNKHHIQHNIHSKRT